MWTPQVALTAAGAGAGHLIVYFYFSSSISSRVKEMIYCTTFAVEQLRL